MATMAYDVFPHSSAGEAPFCLILDAMLLCQLYLNFHSQNSDIWVMKNVEFI